MTTSPTELTPGKAFAVSIFIFIAAVVAVVLLWVIFDAWLAVIALGVAFFGIWALLIYSLNRLSKESGGS